MSTAAPLPSVAELQEQLRHEAPGIKCYHAGDDWRRVLFHGDPIYMPPDLAGQLRPHPTTGKDVVCDGTFMVRDRMGRDRRGTTVLTATAFTMAVFLAKKYALDGVTWMSGDLKKDAERRTAAKARWLSARKIEAEEVWRSRLEFIRRWNEDPITKGTTPTHPSSSQIRAREFLDRFELERSKLGRTFKFISPDGAYMTDELEKYRSYMWVNHRERINDEGSIQEAEPVSAPAEVAASQPPQEGSGSASTPPDAVEASAISGEAGRPIGVADDTPPTDVPVDPLAAKFHGGEEKVPKRRKNRKA